MLAFLFSRKYLSGAAEEEVDDANEYQKAEETDQSIPQVEQ
jgi:hypothetical protein